MPKVIIGIIVIVAIALFIQWTGERDKKLMEWSIQYEECVEREYKTTPTQWRLEHGEYPECNINKNELK